MTQVKKTNQSEDELLILEQRKVKALEKIANSLDALTVWFEEIDKDEWSSRIQYYLAEFHTKIVKDGDGESSETPTKKTTKK
jgi:hypothetical protein